MKSFGENFLENLRIPLGTSWLLGTCMEARGKQELWMKTKPETLEALRELAVIQSAESSNRIEGVTVDKDRILPLLAQKIRPRDRSEEEVFGYKKALDWIHQQHDTIEINETTILSLHRLAQGGFSGDAGTWKTRNNEIIEIHQDGTRSVRFVPVAPELTPEAMRQLCLGYQDLTQHSRLADLVCIASFIFDFLCVHPFRDGNGRVSRLLTLLLLYKHNYRVGRYISLERLVELSKEDYYSCLKLSSQGWHSAQHDLVPFWNYFLGMVKEAYNELGQRVSFNLESLLGKSELVRQKILSQPGEFSLSDLTTELVSTSPQLIKKVLQQMKDANKVGLRGRGRSARWKVRNL